MRRIIIIIPLILTVALAPFSFAQTATSSAVRTPSPTRTPTPIIPPGPPAGGISLTVSPAFINLSTDPGKPVSSQIKIQNNGLETEYLHLRVSKFTTSNGETPVLTDPTPEDTFINWIQFSERDFMVNPNENKTIKFTISPPGDAALGYYYALVVDRIRDVNAKEVGQSALSGAPAISVLLDVRSLNAKRELQLTDFKTDSFIYEQLPIEFEVVVKNSGNIHLVPTGDIFIDQGQTKDIAIIHANGSRGNVLPQSQRTYTASWDDGFLVRTAKVNSDGTFVHNSRGEKVYYTKWDLSKADRFRFGKYTANLLLVYDNGERDIPLEAHVSFWVIPWKILAGAGVVAVLILLGLRNLAGNVISGLANIRKPRHEA